LPKRKIKKKSARWRVRKKPQFMEDDEGNGKSPQPSFGKGKKRGFTGGGGFLIRPQKGGEGVRKDVRQVPEVKSCGPDKREKFLGSI